MNSKRGSNGAGRLQTPCRCTFSPARPFILENQSKVILRPLPKLDRGGLHMEGGDSEVLLKDGAILRADTVNGKGTQQGPGRKVDFGARSLHILFDDHMTVNYILAGRRRRLFLLPRALGRR